MKFSDVPKYIGIGACYNVNHELNYFKNALNDYIEEYGLQLNPEFQRGHVWNEGQQVKYVEHILKGGKSGLDLYFNSPSWMNWDNKYETQYNEFVCVDGLQRITAVLRFLNDEIKVFGLKCSEFEEPLRMARVTFNIHINNLQNEKDVLQWYVEMNDGGTPHTKEEIERVKNMINEK